MSSPQEETNFGRPSGTSKRFSRKKNLLNPPKSYASSFQFTILKLYFLFWYSLTTHQRFQKKIASDKPTACQLSSTKTQGSQVEDLITTFFAFSLSFHVSNNVHTHTPLTVTETSQFFQEMTRLQVQEACHTTVRFHPWHFRIFSGDER